MRKLLSIILSSLIAVSVCGCAKTESNATPVTPEFNSANTFSEDVGKYQQDYSAHYLLQNGNSEYVIVLPDNFTGTENTAAQELLLMFYESTGLKLRSVRECEHNGTPAIYLGNTAYKTQVDGQFDCQTLGVSGFRIITVDKNVVIYGNTDTGTLYGTYSFLTDNLNFEAFTQKYYYVDKGVKEIKLKNYNVTDIPDIQVRVTSNQYLVNDKTLSARLRIVTMYDYFDSFGGNLFHNTFGVLPKADYQKEHPGWYATDGLNLCYTARGDKEEYEKLQNEVLSKLKEAIIANPDCERICFTHEDNQTWCTCNYCKSLIEKYGNTNSVTVIYFMNDLRTRLDSWFEGEGAQYKKDIDLVFFAYHATNKPPVKYNETTKTYEPIDQTVVLKDGVMPLFAESNNDYTHSFYESETKNYAENYKGWHVLTKRIVMWAHVINFLWKYSIFDNFSSSPENYKFYTENGTDALFEEGSYVGHPTSFHVLRTFLFSKLSWDSSLDVNALINRFFKLYFRDASQEMLSYFNAYRQFAVLQKEVYGYGGERVIFISAMQQDFWPYRTLVQWYDMVEKALEKIQPLKAEDQTLYDNLYDNITAERVSVIYPILSIWDEKFTDAELDLFRQQFYEDCVRLGHTESDAFYEKLGIKR